MKGGIGKTTIAALLGLTLAEHRGDRIIAVDANPDAGTLADRLTDPCGLTVRDLLDDLDSIQSWTDIDHYTSLAGRLQVLASEQDPAMSEAFTGAEYQAVCDVLAQFFNIVLTDSGTGMVHSAMGAALACTDILVLAAAPSIDGTTRAARTLDWLVAHGYGELVERAIVVISCDRASRRINRDPISAYFRQRCAAVVEVAPDPHLALGGVIHLEAITKATQQAFLEIAAAVAAQFEAPPPQHRGGVR
jgi:MinD-like ATPase involved in chromosome partitioning or flagellar assembly